LFLYDFITIPQSS